MNNEQINDIAFQIIANAGESVSTSMESIDEAESLNFEKAKELLNKAEQSLVEAHKIHSELLFAFANGTPMDPTILLGHAQDHMTKAEIMIVFAEKTIKMYETFSKKTNQIKI